MKTIVVTGGTRGLGLYLTRRLLGEGYRVVAIGRRATPEIEAEMARHPEQCFMECFDLNETTAIHTLARRIQDRHGRLYGLVNNAAIGLGGILATMHESDIGTLLRVNVEAPILLSKYLVRGMLLNREGRIVNVSSVIATTGYKGLAVYAATKAALSGFTRSLAREVGSAGVTVNAVAPGYMETEMTRGLDTLQLDSIRRRSALNRLAEPADAAGAIAFLLGEQGRNITGTVITIDAGNTA